MDYKIDSTIDRLVGRTLDWEALPVGTGGRDQAARANHLRGTEVAMDRGADVRLVRPLPTAVEGL